MPLDYCTSLWDVSSQSCMVLDSMNFGCLSSKCERPFTLSDSESKNFLLMFAACSLIFSDGSLIFFAIAQCKLALTRLSYS